MKIFDCPRCGEKRDDSGILGNTGVCLICAEAELTYLRGVETAVIFNGNRAYMILAWQHAAKNTIDTFWRDTYNAIANALRLAQLPSVEQL